MGTIELIITALTLAAKFEPVIAAVISALVPALRELHETHGDTVMLTEIARVFREHGITPAQAAGAIRGISVGPVPEGQSQPQI